MLGLPKHEYTNTCSPCPMPPAHCDTPRASPSSRHNFSTPLLEDTKHHRLVLPIKPLGGDLEALADTATGKQHDVAEGASVAVVMHSRGNPERGPFVGSKTSGSLLVLHTKVFIAHDRKLSVLFQIGQEKRLETPARALKLSLCETISPRYCFPIQSSAFLKV